MFSTRSGLIPVVRCLLLQAAVFFLFSLTMCGGGGGGESEKVTVSGVVAVGSDDAPLPGANCRFIDTDGQTGDLDLSEGDGGYQLHISPGVQGFIHCGPQTLPQLNLTTFVSTIGIGPGSRITNEAVSAATTVAADILRQEKNPNPLARKAQLLEAIADGQDRELELIVTLARRLYREMLSEQVDAIFCDNPSSDGGDGGGDGGGSGDGGVGGEAGDGADFSPLPRARCVFVVGEAFGAAQELRPAALADLLDNGQLDRPDLAAFADRVFEGLTETPAEIQAAFEAYFPNGLGDPLATLTDDAGRYFLPIPPNQAGYVRCTPENQPNLVLGAYVPGRQEGTTRHNLDVNPATTLFSSVIAPRLEAEVAAAQENFMEDIDGLETQLVLQPDGDLTGFQLGTDTTPDNADMGLVAFSATALFNAFYKNDLDVDFPMVLAELTESLRVDPDFLEVQGVPATEVQAVADLVNTSIDNTEGDLGTEIGAALAKGRLKVRVRDAADGSPIAGAVVDIVGGSGCSGCGTMTGSDGEVELTLAGLTETPTTQMVRVSGASGYPEESRSVPAVALVTMNVPIYLGDEVAPVVVSTAPPHGATDVPVTLDWISFTFDQSMEGGWRILGDDNWPWPDESKVYWSTDKKVFSISRENAGTPLPAHTTLTFVLNPPPIEEPDFRNPYDVVMETQTFSFTTGAGN